MFAVTFNFVFFPLRNVVQLTIQQISNQSVSCDVMFEMYYQIFFSISRQFSLSCLELYSIMYHSYSAAGFEPQKTVTVTVLYSLSIGLIEIKLLIPTTSIGESKFLCSNIENKAESPFLSFSCVLELLRGGCWLYMIKDCRLNCWHVFSCTTASN